MGGEDFPHGQSPSVDAHGIGRWTLSHVQYTQPHKSPAHPDPDQDTIHTLLPVRALTHRKRPRQMGVPPTARTSVDATQYTLWYTLGFISELSSPLYQQLAKHTDPCTRMPSGRVGARITVHVGRNEIRTSGDVHYVRQRQGSAPTLDAGARAPRRMQPRTDTAVGHDTREASTPPHSTPACTAIPTRLCYQPAAWTDWHPRFGTPCTTARPRTRVKTTSGRGPGTWPKLWGALPILAHVPPITRQCCGKASAPRSASVCVGHQQPHIACGPRYQPLLTIWYKDEGSKSGNTCTRNAARGRPHEPMTQRLTLNWQHLPSLSTPCNS